MSFTCLIVHVVFSTKGRAPILTPEVRAKLYPYLAGIARNLDVEPLAIGGVADHVHILGRLP